MVYDCFDHINWKSPTNGGFSREKRNKCGNFNCHVWFPECRPIQPRNKDLPKRRQHCPALKPTQVVSRGCTQIYHFLGTEDSTTKQFSARKKGSFNFNSEQIHQIRHHMGVSINGDTPKMDGLQWKITGKWMIWEYPHFRKPSISLSTTIHHHQTSIYGPYMPWMSPSLRVFRAPRHVVPVLREPRRLQSRLRRASPAGVLGQQQLQHLTGLLWDCVPFLAKLRELRGATNTEDGGKSGKKSGKRLDIKTYQKKICISPNSKKLDVGKWWEMFISPKLARQTRSSGFLTH